MGWGSEAPDMSGANAAAVAQAGIAREQWNDYKTKFAPVILDQMQQQIDIGQDSYELARRQQEFQVGLTRKYDDRYWGVQVPQEDRLIDDAKNFDTAAEQERQAGEARGDIAQSFGDARGGLRREMGRMGVNPADPRFFATSQRMAGTEALATASAMNKTRQAAKEMGWAKRIDAAALGRGLAGFTSSASEGARGWSGTGMQAGSMGMQGALGALGGLNSTAASAGANFSSAGNTFTNIAGIQQKTDAANMEMLGTMAGSASSMMAMSDRRLKTDIERVGTLANGLPVYTFRYKSGGPVVMGVMADEVKRLIPEAVGNIGGYDAVNYSMLGA